MMVVCTGKGAHRELTLDEFVDGRLVGVPGEPDAAPYWHSFGYWVRSATAQRSSYGRYEVAEPPRLTDTQHFRCRKCGRDTRLSAARLIALLDGLHAAGVWLLDVSYLPY